MGNPWFATERLEEKQHFLILWIVQLFFIASRIVWHSLISSNICGSNHFFGRRNWMDLLCISCWVFWCNFSNLENQKINFFKAKSNTINSFCRHSNHFIDNVVVIFSSTFYSLLLFWPSENCKEDLCHVLIKQKLLYNRTFLFYSATNFFTVFPSLKWVKNDTFDGC